MNILWNSLSHLEVEGKTRGPSKPLPQVESCAPSDGTVWEDPGPRRACTGPGGWGATPPCGRTRSEPGC